MLQILAMGSLPDGCVQSIERTCVCVSAPLRKTRPALLNHPQPLCNCVDTDRRGAKRTTWLQFWAESREHSALIPRSTAGSCQVTAGSLGLRTSVSLKWVRANVRCAINHLSNRLAQRPIRKFAAPNLGQVGPHLCGNAPSRCESALQTDKSRQAKARSEAAPLIEACLLS